MITCRFHKFLAEANLDIMEHFTRYVFHPGMMFCSWRKWWGDMGQRITMHEGLDLCCFQNARGEIRYLSETIRIPAAFSGTVIKTEKDFLGKSIYLRHDIKKDGTLWLHSIYGHTSPKESVHEGTEVAAGEIMALIAGFPEKKSGMLPHLHISFAWAREGIEPERLSWPNLNRDREITLIDPLGLIGAAYSVSPRKPSDRPAE